MKKLSLLLTLISCSQLFFADVKPKDPLLDCSMNAEYKKFHYECFCQVRNNNNFVPVKTMLVRPDGLSQYVYCLGHKPTTITSSTEWSPEAIEAFGDGAATASAICYDVATLRVFLAMEKEEAQAGAAAANRSWRAWFAGSK